MEFYHVTYFCFREFGNCLYKSQMDKARNHIAKKDFGYSYTLNAVVFYTKDSEPINPVMRNMWDQRKRKHSRFDEKEKFAIAASLLIQSYILEYDLPYAKFNLK